MVRWLVYSMMISGIVSTRLLAAEPSVQVIGRMSSYDVAKYLEDIGDFSAANDVRKAMLRYGQDVRLSDSKLNAMGSLWGPRVYGCTQHAFGYISPRVIGRKAERLPISDAGDIDSDPSLREASLKITLDRLRVFDYPGEGVHKVLVEVEARHQAANRVENARFSQLYRVQEGQGAGITGYPVFVGLRVGDQGAQLRARTINIANENDEDVVTFLEGPAFRNGMVLATAANPLSPVVTEFAKGLVELFTSRRKNVPVQSFDVGLDFSTVAARARLREGSYVVVQTCDQVWRWGPWEFDQSTGQIVSKSDLTKSIPFNYIVFSISRMD